MTEKMLERMARLWAEADAAFRQDPSYAIELAQAGSTQAARRDARSLGRLEAVGV